MPPNTGLGKRKRKPIEKIKRQRERINFLFFPIL
jgi:hypothetical protein